jgi:hypothetical protein
MSDITSALLQAYYDRFTTEENGQLSYIRSHEIVQGALTSYTSQYGILPLALIEWGGHVLTPDSFEGSYRSDRKEYTITIYGFVEAYDENYGVMGNTPLDYKGTVNLSQDFETIFNRETFGISQACICTQNIPTTLALPYLLGDQQAYWFYGVALTFKHLWIDRRVAS